MTELYHKILEQYLLFAISYSAVTVYVTIILSVIGMEKRRTSVSSVIVILHVVLSYIIDKVLQLSEKELPDTYFFQNILYLRLWLKIG